ncbi:MAG: DUF6527 family protein [Methanoregula sp.]
MKLHHVFVDMIPETLEEATLYVSIKYATTIHKCCCGCGFEVVAPLSPVDWSITFNGETVSLSPSIGNWSFPCKSHYWIRDSEVIWARLWSRREIETSRKKEQRSTDLYYQRRTKKDKIKETDDTDF